MTILKAKRAFFDKLSTRWDALQDMEALVSKLRDALRRLEIKPWEYILDLGSGTGNLTKAIMEQLGPEGRVVAVDISMQMLSIAGNKCGNSRQLRVCASAEELPLRVRTFHRAICFSAWPHFSDPEKVTSELHRLLRAGGKLHIWHLISRDKVNAIHTQAGEPISGDVLPMPGELAALLESFGFHILEATDGPEGYRVTGIKP